MTRTSRGREVKVERFLPGQYLEVDDGTAVDVTFLRSGQWRKVFA